MTAPISTYDSRFELRLAETPQIDEDKDPELYQELQDIHDAIASVLSDPPGGDNNLDDLLDFLAKFRKVTTITPADSPYTILVTDGTIRVNAATGNVDLVLPAAGSFPGFRWDVKRIDTAPTTNIVEVKEVNGLPIDGFTIGICISPLSSNTFKSFTAGYDLI